MEGDNSKHDRMFVCLETYAALGLCVLGRPLHVLEALVIV